MAAVRTNTGAALDLTQVFKSHTANIWETSHIQALAKAGKNLQTFGTSVTRTGSASASVTQTGSTSASVTQSGSTSVQRTLSTSDAVLNVKALAPGSDKTSRRDAELLHKKAIDAHSAALNAAAAAGSTLPPQLVAWLDVPTTRRVPAKFNYSGLTAEQKAKMKADNHTANRQIYDAEDSFYNNNIREALTEVSRVDLAGNDIFHSSRSDNMTWTMLHQTLVDQKVRIVGFPSHMTFPTLAGSEKATSSWTMVDRASISLALKARVLGTFAGLRLEYHPYDGVGALSALHAYG
ncbi:MAG TPA: hypothetical protein VN828_10790 [Acidobacteriaceae bacterium]|nr:hypothetical protein [Acidobacteriaceae bacterium]